MAWEVEYTNEFSQWWDTLTADEQNEVERRVLKLQEEGPALRRPVVGEVKNSRYSPQMKELRVSAGRADLRILFMFDPRQAAILLLGGDKAQAGYSRWYRQAIKQADRLYDEHLETLRKEGLI